MIAKCQPDKLKLSTRYKPHPGWSGLYLGFRQEWWRPSVLSSRGFILQESDYVPMPDGGKATGTQSSWYCLPHPQPAPASWCSVGHAAPRLVSVCSRGRSVLLRGLRVRQDPGQGQSWAPVLALHWPSAPSFWEGRHARPSPQPSWESPCVPL